MPYTDATDINTALSAAISAGDETYTFPDKQLFINAYIDVPKGTDDLTLVLPKNCVISPTASISGALRLGYTNNNINDCFSGSGLTSYSVSNVARGDQSITLAVGSSAPTPGYFVLVDTTTDNEGNRINGELIKITAYNSSTRVATLDAPVSRDYSATPVIRDVNSRVSTNLTVKGGKLTGKYGTSFNSGGIWATLVDGLTIEGVTATNFDTDFIRAEFCRNVTINGVKLSDYSGVVEGGKGRGCAMFWSMEIEISNSKFNALRHGTMFASCSDWEVNNCEGNSTASHDFDVHGQLSTHGRFYRCKGATTLQIGNGSFWTGDRNIEVDDCNVRAIYIVGDVRDVSLLNSKAQFFNLQSYGTSGQDYRPKRIYAAKCEFHTTTNDIHTITLSGGSWRSFTDLVMRNCLIRHSGGGGGMRCLLMEDAQSAINATFINCTFLSSSARTHFDINGGTWDLSLFQCSFVGGATPCIQFGVNVAGSALLCDNSIPLGYTQYDNDGTITVTVTS